MNIGDGSCIFHQIAPSGLFRHPICRGYIAIFGAREGIGHAFSDQFVENKAGFSKPPMCHQNIPPFQVIMYDLLMFPRFVRYRYFHFYSCSTLSKYLPLPVP